jgi:glycosyltransferase 2 family protein
MAWALHGVRLKPLLRSMQHIDWFWVAVAVALNMATYYVQGCRWELILRPLGRITPMRATEAIYAGVFANEAFPLKMGELVRGWVVSRRLRADFSAVIPSMVVERFFDGVCLAIAVGVCAFFIPLPASVARAVEILGALLVTAGVGFLWVAIRQENRPLPDCRGGKFKCALLAFFANLENGLRAIGKSRFLWASLAVTLLLMLLQILSFWIIMLAYGLDLSFWVGTVVTLLVHLGTSIPNAPANIGSFQFFTVVGLVPFGVDKAIATGFSLVVFFLLSIPLVFVGFVAFHRSGLTIPSLRKAMFAGGVTADRPALALPEPSPPR